MWLTQGSILTCSHEESTAPPRDSLIDARNAGLAEVAGGPQVRRTPAHPDVGHLLHSRTGPLCLSSSTWEQYWSQATPAR